MSGITPTNDLSDLQIAVFHRSGFCVTEDLAVNPLNRLTAFFCDVVKDGYILKSWSWFYIQVFPASL